MPAGEYQLSVAAHAEDEGDNLAVTNDAGESLGAEIVLTTFRVEKNKASFTASDIATLQPIVRYNADLAEMRLFGFLPPRETIKPGELFQVGLF